MSDEKRCCPTDAKPATCHYTPEGDDLYIVGPLDAKAGILLVGDIFGMHPNTKHTADEFAKAGYLVVMPDFFGAEAWSESDYPPKSYEDPKWVSFYKLIHDVDRHHATATRCIALLKKLGVQKVAALGLCWGSVVTMRLAAEGAIDAASVAHPSFLTPEAISAVKTPLCLLPAMDDKGVDDMKTAMDALNVEPKFFKQYTHVKHGFMGARFDHENPSAAEKEERADAMAHLLGHYQKTLH